LLNGFVSVAVVIYKVFKIYRELSAQW
jgi:hypothetical protein